VRGERNCGVVPRQVELQPDREFLAERYETFRRAG